MNEIYLFVSTFALVFALGFQSLNVNGGHYILAFITSFVIGASNLVLYKMAPNADVTEMLAFLMGGPFGIVASMVAHRRYVRRRNHRAHEKFLEQVEQEERRFREREFDMTVGPSPLADEALQHARSKDHR